ncbi:unnamed protein product [Ixodes persulcatus]
MFLHPNSAQRHFIVYLLFPNFEGNLSNKESGNR